MKIHDLEDEGVRAAASTALEIFESLVGASNLEARIQEVGPQSFLKFVVGRDAPLYDYALRELQRRLDSDNPFVGLVGIDLAPADRFPTSVEAAALSILLARTTRPVAQGQRPEGFTVPYVPFQNREDHKVAQPATQLIVGRRGVGKSTLIMRARELLAGGPDLTFTLDMQAYSELAGAALQQEVLVDLLRGVHDSATLLERLLGVDLRLGELVSLQQEVEAIDFEIARAAPRIRRAFAEITKVTQGQIYFFLDDFHLIRHEEQPFLLQLLHGIVKGANGWLKVAGLRSLLNYYDPSSRKGLQIPGDAQMVSLDLTLENPQAAEGHLAAILLSFMAAIGYSSYVSVLPEHAFRRLVWANAGVPRDFLQMFARSLEHANKARHASITLGDINIAIGEFGQRKIDEMQEDARNVEGHLRDTIDYLVDFCLSSRERPVNAFLVRTGQSAERTVITTLSDLRLVHLIHQSITPDRAGETYEAFILDYSLFTGFRRKRNVKEMLPEEGEQFRASALRQLPKLPDDFLSRIGQAVVSKKRNRKTPSKNGTLSVGKGATRKRGMRGQSKTGQQEKNDKRLANPEKPKLKKAVARASNGVKEKAKRKK